MFDKKKDKKQKILNFQGKIYESGKNNLVIVSFNKDVARDALARMIIINEFPFRFV